MRFSEIISLHLLIIYTFSESVYVKEVICSFENKDDSQQQLCNWSNGIDSDSKGDAGVKKASNATTPYPTVDTNPGNVNGSYFYYDKPESYSSDVTVLRYKKTQRFVTKISFDYYISGVVLLRVLKIGIGSVDVISDDTWHENKTGKWDHASAMFSSNVTNQIYGFSIISPSLEEELGEAASDVDLVLCVDNLTIEFTLPCDFDQLSEPGNFYLSSPGALNIPLGEVTMIQFTASSPVCEDGPFVYSIFSNDKSELDDIFSINATTGAVTVDATGPSLVTEGVSAGHLLVSVYVEDSDYLETDEIVTRTATLIYKQEPTIAIGSSLDIHVQAQTNFTYEIQATSRLGSTLSLDNFQTEPPSLSDSISLNGSTVIGQVTHSGLLDVIKSGKVPTFSVDISDEYDGTRTLTVELLLPNTPPTFDKSKYIFKIDENVDTIVAIGNFTVGDINEKTCKDIAVFLNSTDANAEHYYEIIDTEDVYETDSLCMFLFFSKLPFDYEMKNQYEFTIVANDSDGLIAVAMVTVNVLSVNEYSPQFSFGGTQKISADYNSYEGEFIYMLEAEDQDTGPAGELHYDIISGNDDRNFKLYQTSNNFVEIQSNSEGLVPGIFNLTVRVRDGQNPVKKNTITVIIAVHQDDIDCTNENYGPPVLEGTDNQIISLPVYSDAMLHCNYTSYFLSAYPVKWTIMVDFSPTLVDQSDPHYSFEGTKLIIHNLTLADNQDTIFYRCNASNPCGSVLSGLIYVRVVDLPESINDLTIKNGPFVDNSVVLTWSPPSDASNPINGYRIKVRDESDSESYYYRHYADLYYTKPGETDLVSEATVDGLNPGTNYSVIITTYNIAGESASNEVSFFTNVSAPDFASFDAISLTNHSIHIEWVLAYTGGSQITQMLIEIKSHEVGKRKRSVESPLHLTIDVDVYQKIIITPKLPFGRSYEVIGSITNEYGTTQNTITVFVGFQDVLKCSFTEASLCGWALGDETTSTLQSASASEKQEPKQDAMGNSTGVYVLGSPAPPDTTWTILSYHDISYLCGYSFYYQAYDEVRLILMSASSLWNESVYWISSTSDDLEWTKEEVPAGDIPISTTPQELIFMMESLEQDSSLSFVAVDEVTLYFCLPCDYTSLNDESIMITSPMNTTLYLRSYQTLKIITELINCSNPIFNYQIKEVIPSHLQSKISIPNQREGSVVMADVTPSMAKVGTEGSIQISVEVASANYKHTAAEISKIITIPFVVSEKFENCSDIKSCSFDSGLCDWIVSDQSDVSLTEAVDSTGNRFLTAQPASLSSSNEQVVEIMQTVINDSYCGVSFLYKTHGADIQVSVEGLGELWSTLVVEELNSLTPHQSNESLSLYSWQEVSLYIDILGVQMITGRKLMMEMILSEEASVDSSLVSFDNITLHPCVDCQAKECSCISCIQQCSTDPCQPGYYLSLEVNQCRPCPTGHYCSDWRSLPAPCPRGTFCNKTGAINKDDCQVCPQGTYALSVAENSCTKCPPGHYCSEANTLPVECPVGTYFNTTGAWNKDMCQVCPDNTYSLKTGAGYCEDCPDGYDCIEGGSLPVAHASSTNITTVLLGVGIGFVVFVLIAAMFCIIFYCRSKARKSVKKKRREAMYKKNFMYGLDNDSGYTASGPKTGTVRTASTILTLTNEKIDLHPGNDHSIYENADAESSDDEVQQGEKQGTLLQPLGRFSQKGTVSSLKSLESARGWSDTNPFPASDSHSDMSVLIELDDEKDHVWNALNKKTKKSESEF